MGRRPWGIGSTPGIFPDARFRLSSFEQFARASPCLPFAGQRAPAGPLEDATARSLLERATQTGDEAATSASVGVEQYDAERG